MKDRLVIGPIELRPAARELLLGGRPVRLGARAFDVLTTLVGHRERIVARHELMTAVWPGQRIDENNLATQIALLRKALGPGVIATVPGRGYQFVQADRAVEPGRPAPQSIAARRGPRPPPTLSMSPVGRESDLVRLSEALATHRLVTVAGPGGVGKSTLVLAYLASAQAEHPAAWVNLSALHEPSAIAPAIGLALDIELGPDDPVVGLLRASRTLAGVVVLDNAEHLVDAVASLARKLLDAAPALRVVVTSQVPLHLRTEQVVRVQPLPVPPQADLPAAEAAEYAAVRLFADRAGAADDAFALDAHSAPLVAAVCRRLDGLPLAIELAAARVRVMGIDGVSTALAQRMQLLRGSGRDAPARHQALAAALDWSHGLLTPPAQRVLRRVAVFAGSFTLPLFLQVASDAANEDDAFEALDALGELVDRSLVAMDDEPAGPRYRLLESTHVYAANRLSQAGELAAMQARHASALLRHFSALFDRRYDGTLGSDEALELMVRDLDNARLALAWALAHDPGMAVALASPLSFVLHSHGFAELQRVWEVTAPHHTRADVPDAVRAAWLRNAALLWRPPGERALAFARRAVALCRARGDDLHLYLSLYAVGLNPMATREECLAVMDEMLRLEHAGWAPLVRHFGAVAMAFLARGDPQHMATHLARALALARQAGNHAAELRTQYRLASAEFLQGHAGDAIGRLQDLAQRCSPTRDQETLVLALIDLAQMLLMQGDDAQARMTVRRAWTLAEGYDAMTRADLLAAVAALAARAHEAVVAVRLLGFAQRLMREGGGDPAKLDNADLVERLATQDLGLAAVDAERTRGSGMDDGEAAGFVRRVLEPEQHEQR